LLEEGCGMTDEPNEPLYSIEQLVAMEPEEFQNKVSAIDIRNYSEEQLTEYVLQQPKHMRDKIREYSYTYLKSSLAREMGIRDSTSPSKKDMAVLDFISALVLQKKLDPRWFQKFNIYV
jgi:hypothetical protein